jgi:hypothetical protein
MLNRKNLALQCVILAYLRILNPGLQLDEGNVSGLPLANDDLVKELRKSYTSEVLLEAFAKVDRAVFCGSPTAPLRGCYVDMPYRDEVVHLSAPGIYGKYPLASLISLSRRSR